MANIIDLTHNLTRHLKTITPMEAERLMLEAAVDFCKDSHAWRLERSIVLPDGISSTRVSIPEGSAIHVIRYLSGEHGTLGVVSTKQARGLHRKYKQGKPLFYYLKGVNQLSYFPTETGNEFYDIEVVLIPTRVTAELDDDLVALHIKTIEAKAMFEALTSPSSPAYSPKDAFVWQERYFKGLEEANDREDQNLTGRTVTTGYGGI